MRAIYLFNVTAGDKKQYVQLYMIVFVEVRYR